MCKPTSRRAVVAVQAGVGCEVLGKQLGNMIAFGIGRIFHKRVDAWGRQHKAYRLIQKAVDNGGFFALFIVRVAAGSETP